MILVVNNLEVELRAGTIADIPLLLSFIRSMAAFEKLAVTATEESLRAALFGEEPAARTLLAFVDGNPIGYATYFFTFATMVGKRGLWLDDLYIDPAFRGKGIGQALMAYLADIALQNQPNHPALPQEISLSLPSRMISLISAAVIPISTPGTSRGDRPVFSGRMINNERVKAYHLVQFQPAPLVQKPPLF